jgi:hypothetical protein
LKTLSAVEGRSMRPTFMHVFTGLLLGVALAGLLNVPGQVVAHQESIPPVRPPQVVKPKREPVVRVAPALERPPVTKKAPPAKPRVVVERVVVRAYVPRPQPAPAASPSPAPAPVSAPEPVPAAKPKPSPSPPAPPPPPPPPPAAEPAPPKVVLVDDDGKKPKKAKKAKKPKKPKKDKPRHEDDGGDDGDDDSDDGEKDKKDKKDKKKDD